MPGILGTFCPDDSNQEVMSAMFSAIRKPPRDAEFLQQRSDESKISLGSMSNQSFLHKKKILQTKEITVVFDGILFNEQQFNTDKDEPFAKTIYKLYLKFGATFVKNLRGHFVIAIFDLPKQKLFLYTDHFATKPVYFYQENDHFYFCSELKGIIPVGKREKQLNQSALINAFALGYVVGTQTIYSNIHKLSEGSILTYDLENTKFQIQNYYKFPTEPVSASEPKLLDDLSGLFDQAVGRILNTTVKYGYESLLTLSGGLDSRAVLASAVSQNFRPIYTIGIAEPNSGDEIYAKEVAKTLNTNHLFTAYNRGNWLLDSFEQCVAASELMYHYIDVARMVFLFGNLRADKFGIVHTGMLGDSLMGSHITPNDLKRRGNFDIEELSEALMNRLSFGKLEIIKRFLREISDTEMILQSIQTSILENLESEYTDYKDWTTAFHHWDLKNRQRAILGYARGIEEQMEFSSPFYDIDFFNLAVRIPSEQKVNRKLYYKLLKRRIFTNELASIPVDDKGVILNESSKKMLWASRLKKAKSILGGVFNTSNGKLAPSKPYQNWMKNNHLLRDELRHNLTPLYCADMFGINRTKFNAQLKKWSTDPENAPNLDVLNLFYLAGINRWIQQYHGNTMHPELNI